MQTKTTYIETRRAAAKTAMLQLCTAIGISEEEYSQKMLDYGLEYLNHYASPIERKGYEESRVFWNWWKIQWTIREEEFMSLVLKLPAIKRYWLWEKLHDPVVLSGERTPNGQILGESWQVMKCKVTQEKSRKRREMGWVDDLLAGVICADKA